METMASRDKYDVMNLVSDPDLHFLDGVERDPLLHRRHQLLNLECEIQISVWMATAANRAKVDVVWDKQEVSESDFQKVTIRLGLAPWPWPRETAPTGN